MNDCGIYLIENKTTGQKYIGQSTKILERWKNHQFRKHQQIKTKS